MKIGKINIVSFGGLKNKQIDFSGDFSVIYGDNENGKSTVMAFIKMMFYGTERGSSQISKNPRKKYAPWDGSPMAGSIDFEVKGKNYRLEREFKSSNSTDRAVLTDLDLGEKAVVPPDIGVKLFGLSVGAFERSVFIGQSGFGESDSAAEGEINGKLSNIALSGDESVSYETVNRRLEKARLAIMSKSGRAGEYDKNIKLLNGLKEQLNAAEAIYKAHGDYTEYAAELTENTEKQAAKAAELKKIINSEQDIRNAAKLKEMLAAKEELDKAKEEFCLSDGGVIDDMYVGKVKMCLAKLEAAAEKLNDKTAEVQRLTENLPRQILRFIIIDYQRIQQSLAPDKRSHTRCFAQFSHLFPEYQSQPVCPVRQLFVPYYLKRRNSHCRSNRISAKSGAMLPRTDNIHHFIA